MKINITNKTKVAEAIDLVEGKAKQRCFDPKQIEKMVESAEKKLALIGIPKKYWVGCLCEYIPEALPNSYKFGGQGTYATLKRYSSGWFLSSVERKYCPSQSYGGDSRVVLYLSEMAKAAIPNEFTVL